MTVTPTDDKLLGIYLNDRHALLSAAATRADRLAEAEAKAAGAGELQAAAEGLSAELASLRGAMAHLGLSVREYKTWAARGAELLGRAKPNGHLTNRSPLTRLVELEALLVAATAAAGAWRVLRVLAETDGRLDAYEFEVLGTRAAGLVDRVARLRDAAATTSFVERRAAPSPTVPRTGPSQNPA